MAVLDPIRRLRAMFFSGGRTAPWQAIMMPRTQVDFRREVGDGMGSATVMAPLLWIMRSFPEAPPIVHRVLDDGQLQHAVGHPLVSLLRRPNRHLSGSLQWMATMASFFVAGNAYWIKVRDQQGRVVELWWAPDWTMTPVGSDDGSEFLTHYEYRPGSQRVNLHPDDVVHFRYGLDPRNPRLGLSPLASVLREVFTDDEAANFTAALLRNMGVPGLLVAPEQGDYSPSSDEVDETKTYMRQMFTGDRRGEPLVMTGPTKVTQFGFSPEQLNLKELRRIPEERVTAVLGVPAIVAGLGAGLDRSTFTNTGEAREMAYESCIIPAQRLIGEELRHQLAGDFEPDVERVEVGFDLTKVRVLAEDEERMARRWDLMVKGGWVTVGEGRRAVGLPVDETHDVFLRPLNTTELAADPSKRPPPAPADDQVRKLMAGVLASTRELDDALAAGTSRNGNGHAAG